MVNFPSRNGYLWSKSSVDQEMLTGRSWTLRHGPGERAYFIHWQDMRTGYPKDWIDEYGNNLFSRVDFSVQADGQLWHMQGDQCGRIISKHTNRLMSFNP